VARVLYVADTGSGRILRINPDSGQFVRNARHNFSIYSSMAETFEYSMYTCTQQDVFASGIYRPSGLHVDGQFVYVGEHGTGKILVYEKQTGVLISSVPTGAQGLLGLAKSPLTNELWYADGPGNRIGKVVVDTPCGLVSNHNLHNTSAAASAVDWNATTCTAVPYQDTAADTERFVHEAFLNTHNSSNFPANYPSDYANVTAAQCELVNFDILLMEGFICHVCLPEPCKNGGQCAHHPGVYTSGGFSCECPAGWTGDTCQFPMQVSSVVAQVTLNLDLSSYDAAGLEGLQLDIRADLAALAGVSVSQVVIEELGVGSVWVRFRIVASSAAGSSATSPIVSLRTLQTKVDAGGVQIAGGTPIGSVLTLDLQILAPRAFEDIAYPPPSSTHDGDDDNPLWRPAVIVALALGMLGTGVGVGFAIAKCDSGKGEGNAATGKNVQENHYDDVEAKPFSPGDGRLMRQMIVERGKANAVTKTTP